MHETCSRPSFRTSVGATGIWHAGCAAPLPSAMSETSSIRGVTPRYRPIRRGRKLLKEAAKEIAGGRPLRRCALGAIVVLIEDKASEPPAIQELIADGCHAVTAKAGPLCPPPRNSLVRQTAWRREKKWHRTLGLAEEVRLSPGSQPAALRGTLRSGSLRGQLDMLIAASHSIEPLAHSVWTGCGLRHCWAFWPGSGRTRRCSVPGTAS